ncbi:MerR family transcriptional regulator [Metabacillus sp. 84]|uniref:MerR family transcriptional regulator n=1 Tax=unclassified Metabacillus TaxID=2675274 RepID=UPI003CEA3D11
MYTIGQFAKKTSVTIRTLRYYDQQKLLKPSYVSESGRRYYKDEDLVILQQILSLKFLDFSLKQIRKLLTAADGDLKSSLEMQRELMKHKQSHISRVILSLDHALTLLEEEKRPNLQILAFVIESIQKEDEHMEWVKTHFPEKYAARLETFSEEEWLILHKKTVLLFQEMKDSLQEYTPESNEIQMLIRECLRLLSGMLGEEEMMTKHTYLGQNWDRLEAIAQEEIPAASPFTEEEEKLIARAFEFYWSESKGEKKGTES